ncbi:MAG: Fur family transcriptional regulator [Planctomycetota bacterium]|jgi:Fur family ferric uptake transcriptional regulator
MKTVKIEKKVRQLLKAVKLRRTRQRTAVLTTLTIYRVLEKLLDAGLVHRAFLRKRTWHYELSHNCSEKQCHPHFTCTDCGDTHCLTDVNLPMATSPNNGFVFQRQQVRLEGLCPRCSS